MRRNEGFSLLEMILALFLSTGFLLAFFVLLREFQWGCADLALMIERDQNLQLFPLLVPRLLLASGNNRWNQGWEGLSESNGRVSSNSDMDGPEGFPDGALQNSFESIVLQHSGTDLQIKSGSSSFQPALKNISDLSSSGTLPSFSFTVEASTGLPVRKTRRILSDAVRLDLYLWNYRSNLFAEAP
ncbi:MAG: hypothetical protein HY645_00620 [Acidobacteria bacterium]|nr:hypothetical protein [Acidobacteriota bacterium]